MSESADQLAYSLFQALQKGDIEAVLEGAPAAIAAARERPKLEARLHAWVAQAHLQRGDAAGAQAAVFQGLRAARAAADTEGLKALREIQASVLAREQMSRPLAVPDTTVGLANTKIDRGEVEEGERLAEKALEAAEVAGDNRERVLALLTLARLPDRTEESIQAAARVADDSGDMNLVTAVARAMKAAQIEPPAHVF